jgi:hypothetical protein
MQKQHSLGIPAAILAALTLAALTACDEQPTEVGLVSAGEAAFTGIGDTGIALGGQTNATPSTNEINKANGWAYVEWNSDDAGVGEAPLRLVSTRGFASCFEYRIDGEAPKSPDNYNPAITDGLWEFECVNNSTFTLDLDAESHVDVRMVFGAERDERFDWTRFYVMTAVSKEDCRDGGWQAQGFANQGQCIRYVETGKDSRSTGVFGAVTWTSYPGVEGLRTEFAVNAATETGSVWFQGLDGGFTMAVECAAVLGDEAWAGGTVTHADGAYADRLGHSTLFYAQDDGATDVIGSWKERSCDHGFPGSGPDEDIWRGRGTVTDGDLEVR